MILDLNGEKLSLIECTLEKCECDKNLASIVRILPEGKVIDGIFKYAEERSCPRPLPPAVGRMRKHAKLSKGACAFIGSLAVAFVALVCVIAVELGAFN